MKPTVKDMIDQGYSSDEAEAMILPPVSSSTPPNVFDVREARELLDETLAGGRVRFSPLDLLKAQFPAACDRITELETQLAEANEKGYQACLAWEQQVAGGESRHCTGTTQPESTGAGQKRADHSACCCSRLREVTAERDAWVEREAKVCPEDFGFEEVIESLRRKLAAAESSLSLAMTVVDAVEACSSSGKLPFKVASAYRDYLAASRISSTDNPREAEK
jgi:hypothetical protein